MNGRQKVFLALAPAAAAAALVLVGADAPKSPADGYEVKGKYYETCACTVSCPCAANKFVPTEGHCDAVMLVAIDKGQAGGVSMDGLKIVVVIKSPQGRVFKEAFGKGDMDLMSIYLDDKANEKQRAAMPRLLGGLFGTAEVKNTKAPVFVPISFEATGDVAKFGVAGGTKLAAEIENLDLAGETKHAAKTGAKKSRISLTNSAPFPWITDLTQGFSHSFKYDDYGTKWEYKDRNAFFGVFNTKGTLPAEKKG